MVRFRLPDIGEGLAEAELLSWSVAVGDAVKEGQELAVISTDKVNVELPSPAAGTIRTLHGSPGDIIPVGTIIAEIDDGKGATDDKAAEEKKPAPHPVSSGQQPSGTDRPASGVRAAPYTRRRAAELELDIESVSGTGPGGQVLLGDVEAAAVSHQPDSGQRSIRLRGARRAAARRLAESQHGMVTTTMSFEFRADALLEACNGSDGARLSPLVPLTRHLVEILAAHPHFNANLRQDDFELIMFDAVHLGLAVDTPEGLVVPVIRDTQALSMEQLADALGEAARRARAGKLDPQQVTGSTFTLSSTGGLEQALLTSTTPIINPPNVATLWVSRIQQRPRVTNGQLEAGPMMSASLSFDHRFINGADGVSFINDLVAAVE